jgi:hypothetical protein
MPFMIRRTVALSLLTVLASLATACSSPPTVDEAESSSTSALNSCTAAQTGDHYEFLDDACHKKFVPGDLLRAWSCPNAASSVGAYRRSSDPIVVDGDALRGIVPAEMHMTVVLVRRVDGVPYYRYLSNGSHDVAIEPLSSTKFMAVANAATRIRAVSNGEVGLDSSVDGVPVGDLVSVITTYQEGQFTSNGLARYFHDVGGRERANALIHDWLHRPASETFGGNYGAPDADLGFTFESPGATTRVVPDRDGAYANHLSTLTMAEFTKRLALHREDAATRLPGIQWKDLEVLFYGAAASKLFPTQKLGGMSADTAIYVQQAIDMASLERRSQGRWRIFSKLGFGESGFVHNSYTCAPSLDATGKPIPGDGVELVISMQAPRVGAERAQDAAIAKVYRDVVSRVVEHRLE